MSNVPNGKVIVNARLLSKRLTGVPRTALEIVSRLILSRPEDYLLVGPVTEDEYAGGLAVAERGRIRQGHMWEQLELPGIVRKAGGRGTALFSPGSSGPISVERQLVMAHDLFPVEHPEWYSRAFGAWYRLLWPRLFRNVRRIAANSEYTRQRLLEFYGLPEEKVVTCRLGYDERFRVRPSEEIETFREENDIPERYFLYLGSIEPRKNLSTLFRAWQSSAYRSEGVKLVIAGSVGREDIFRLESSTAGELEDPSIRLLGFFSDEKLPLLYQAAEFLALPSLAEGFGLPILEAMACGTPVICSDNSAMSEVAGGAARLVPTMDVEAWAEAIDEMLHDARSRRHLSRAGIERVSHFSWEKTAGEIQANLALL